MRKSGKNPYNVQGISFENEALLNDAKARAKSFGLSLSNYINQLVKNDLDDAQETIVRPRNVDDAQYRMNDAPTSMQSANSPQDIAPNNLGKRAVKEVTGEGLPPTPGSEDACIDRKVYGIARHAGSKPDRPEKRGK